MRRLCIHTITTKHWSASECIQRYAEAGVGGITFWRNTLAGHAPEEIGKQASDAGLQIVSLCRGGFFPASSPTERKAAIDDNLRCIDDAQALGAPLIVLVCGAVPGQPLSESRLQIQDGIAAVLPHAQAAGVKLAIEPLHPMYADARSAVNTMRQAHDICDELGSPTGLGIAVDVYHVWWDPELEPMIALAGNTNRLLAFHICDWKTPTLDLLNDRGLMGEGCIPIRQISDWVDATGFSGPREVEIFSEKHWASDQAEYLQRIVQSYQTLYPEHNL